jgi:2-polyprenyl-3-methyl-5-hydroxy-6-metoxy-1,4-benzoquinol methylase
MAKHKHGGHGGDDRHGARQPERFDPARAVLLDDPVRFDYLPPDEVFATLAAPSGGRVVDFGTGTGAYAIKLALRRPDLDVIVLDEQQEMLELLQAKPAAQKLPNLKPVHTAEIARLRGTADRVLALNVLHEVGDEALRTMAALLKSNGLLVVIDWNAGVERPVGPPRDHVYTTAEARERLAHANLQIESELIFKYHYGLVARRAQ